MPKKKQSLLEVGLEMAKDLHDAGVIDDKKMKEFEALRQSDYIAFIYQSAESGEYSIMFPDFPGLTAGGSSLDKAIKHAQSGLTFHMERMLKDNEKLPKPTRLKKMLGYDGAENVFCFVKISI